jgi:putative ABC transport system permease protein
VSPGFDSQHLWVAQFSLASNRYKTASSSAELLEQLCEKIQANPGVEGAASVTGLPLERGLNLILFPANQPEKTVYAEYRIIAPEYFDAMRIRMVAGRSFFAGDSRQNMPVAIVNETLAKLWWPQESSLGHYISVESTMGGMFSDLTREIVGVAADVHESALSAPPAPTIFVPLRQIPDSIAAFANRTFPVSIVIRTGNNISPAEQVHNVLNTADPDLPIISVRPLADVLSASLGRQRFYTSLIAGFGAFALLLNAIGLYGLLSYQIVLKTREIGVRIALGAPRSEVVLTIVRRGVGLVLLGALLGILAVPLEIRVLASMIYNVHNAIPVVVGAALFVLAAVATLTSLLSAVRVVSIEPAMTLNIE